jgi:beta-N-acetylhexosaminidase
VEGGHGGPPLNGLPPVRTSRRFSVIVALVTGLVASLAAQAKPQLAQKLDRQAKTWVDKSLAGLDLRGKAAQLVVVRAYGMPEHPDSESRLALLDLVRKERVGGVCVFRSELYGLPTLLDELQAAAPLPLLISADLERSLAFRVQNGTVSLPDAMAIGALPPGEAEAAARFAGELTAREGRAAGIHWAFAPVADVNNNPANPIINLRSYGEDPAAVSRLVAAYVEGAREGGILTSAKHFPGHGDTALDSHLELPTIGGDRGRLEKIELAPFRAAIAAGVDTVMTAHLALPALDPSGKPATLSPAISTDLLRGELGFKGLIVTDAMEMKGVGATWMGEAAVQAILAGADVLLLPADPRVAIDSLVRAVEEGRLSEERIELSARRILEAKSRLGLHQNRQVDAAALQREVGRPADVARALEIAKKAITVVRDDKRLLPLRAEERLRILHLLMSSDAVNGHIGAGGGEIENALRQRGAEVVSRRLGPDVSPATAARILAEASGYSHVLVSAFVRVTSSKGHAQMDPTHAALLESLAEAGAPLLVVSYGNPYLLSQFPHVPAYLCAYSAEEASQKAAIATLFAEHEVVGRLPVSLPGLYPLGHGISIQRRPLELEAAGPADPRFAEADALIDGYLAKGAFPGGVYLVAQNGKILHQRAFGQQSYGAGATPVAMGTIYDLASLTKVIATTTAAMILVDEERLSLDAKVQDYLPRFQGPGKDQVTVRHLLSHSSGIDWWAALYKEIPESEKNFRKAFLDRVYAMELKSTPGTEMKYSDLGIALLGEILERVSGRPLDAFVKERVFSPLGMKDTGWRPAKSLLPRIAPTEKDGWRGRTVHGEVHDENAFALGGVAPHAGLFGTAGDLARFAQMMLWKGVYANQRIVSRKTVEAFTRPLGLPPGSSRALGWDTKSPEGGSAGKLFSAGSFGHTGFTGTSIWIDPQRQLFLILLTNRVHPTRDNIQIREVRPALADAVIRAVDPAATPPPALAGLDRVAAGEVALLAGKKLGLLSHAASVTLDGRHAAQVFRDRKLDVVRLFSPEHGLQGRAAAGEKVDSGVDPGSGLPVVSLYGKNTKPTPEDLAGLDALVIDLQDAGVRFFTYSSTLLLCLEAAAEAGIEVIVLDRPNPLGGERVEGPVRAGGVPISMVSRAPGPLVHGLTLGEMARLANARLPKPAKLEVIAVQNWGRGMAWPATGREWIAPSPNLRSAEAALAYPGVALLESTNVTEGRGTEAPFLLFGAPWLDPSQVKVEVPGYRLEQATFTPRASPAAPEPKYVDQECHGFRVVVTDPKVASPWWLGVELLIALSKQPGFEWRDDGKALEWLLGTPVLLERLRAGQSAAEIVAADDADVAAWKEARRPFLLY